MQFLPEILAAQSFDSRRSSAPTSPLRSMNPMLGLQQQVGNQSVMSLLQGKGPPIPLPASTDPRLKWTLAAQQENPGLDQERVPFTDPRHTGRSWDAQAILSRLTQVDDMSETSSDPARCGTNSVLAIAIMAGPEAVMRLAIGLIQSGADQAGNAALAAARRAECLRAAMDLIHIGPRIADEALTFGELSRIAHSAKILMSSGPTVATTGHEVNSMASLVGTTQAFGSPIFDREQFVTYMQTLKPGEAFTLLIDSDVLAEDESPLGLRQVNHYITVGAESSAPGRKPRLYLYDPWPRDGSQLLYSDNNDFWAYFETAGGKWKSVYKVSHTQPY